MPTAEFVLQYQGLIASSQNSVQFYDFAHALVGFERAISLTTHLLINGEVLTQSPSTKGFQLVAVPFEEGSFASRVLMYIGGGSLSLIMAAGVASPDSAFGWLARSALEYVIEETLGFEPNFDDSLGNQIEQYRLEQDDHPISDDLSQGRFDSLIEKIEPGLKAVHRPIIRSQSAEVAQIGYKVAGSEGYLGGYFSQETYDHIDRTITSDDFSTYEGNISSYNTNTFKGRIFVSQEKRTIPFELSDQARNIANINKITRSLSANGSARLSRPYNTQADISITGLRNESVHGRLKSIFVTDVA